MMNLISVYQGISTPVNELIQQLSQQGWELGKVQFKDNNFIAEASNQFGDTISKYGPDQGTAIANVLLAASRKNHIRSLAQFKVGMWQHTWTDKLKDIAEAYRKAPIYDPKAVAAYKALADDSVHRALMLGQHIAIEPTNDPNPYKSTEEMRKDIRDKRHYYQSQHSTAHPVWTPEQHAAFRTVHDILGHGVAGGDFDWHGRNLATAAHAPLLEPIAQQALFSEAVARPAYMHTYGVGPHKIALYPDFMDKVQGEQNPGGHMGIHPSQSLPPGPTPQIRSKTASAITIDPNYGWSSGAEPLPVNAYIHHGDPLEAYNTLQNAKLIDTGWSQFKRGDGSPDRTRMKQAIVNAFRVTLLSPRKDLRWNAIHYQDIMDIPGDVDDPKIYWDRLDKRRQDWNAAQVQKMHGDSVPPETLQHMMETARTSHQLWRQFWPQFFSVVFQKTGDYNEAKDRAERMLMEWEMQEMDKLAQLDEKKAPEKQMTGDQLERKAQANVVKRMKLYIKDSQTKMDFESSQESLFETEPESQPQGDRYGAFMGSHLRAISQISQHSDELMDAALEDIKNHDGAGWHFRNEVASLGIRGVGPKVASFTWLLLQPMTSQLATVDTHIADILGLNFEKDMNNRDYYKYERQLEAGRDAAGYGHVPLGAFQWGMWDLKRTGQGTHQDHSAMKIVDPLPHDQIDWASKVSPGGVKDAQQWGTMPPDWWANTQAIRDSVGEDWDKTYGKTFPKSMIPYQTVEDHHYASTEEGMRPGMRFEGKTAGRMQELQQRLNLIDPRDVWAEIGELESKTPKSDPPAPQGEGQPSESDWQIA